MHVMIIKVKKKIQEDYCLTLLDKNIDGHFYPLERSQKVIGKWQRYCSATDSVMRSEDRVLSCLRANSSGNKLRRIINIKREDSTNVIYKRWNPKKTVAKLEDEMKELKNKLKTLSQTNDKEEEINEINEPKRKMQKCLTENNKRMECECHKKY